MAVVPLIPPQRRWECPACTSTDVTYEMRPHTRFHACAGANGLTTPYVPAGTRAKVIVNLRQDYERRGESLTRDADGRPVMSIVVERPDGEDVAVFAPCIELNLRSA